MIGYGFEFDRDVSMDRVRRMAQCAGMRMKRLLLLDDEQCFGFEVNHFNHRAIVWAVGDGAMAILEFISMCVDQFGITKFVAVRPEDMSTDAGRIGTDGTSRAAAKTDGDEDRPGQPGPAVAQ